MPSVNTTLCSIYDAPCIVVIAVVAGARLKQNKVQNDTWSRGIYVKYYIIH